MMPTIIIIFLFIIYCITTNKLSPIYLLSHDRAMSSRHKAIAIPMHIINDEPHFLIVHDRRFKEWTFVTGGCRKREIYNPLRCALRELEEETRGVVNIKAGAYSYYKFDIQDEEDSEMTNVYHVYILDFPMSLRDQEKIITRFNMNKEMMTSNKSRFKKQYDENDFINFDTMNSIQNRSDIWNMIKIYVIRNIKFKDAIYSKRTTFNLKK